jgi:hypothetical protein
MAGVDLQLVIPANSTIYNPTRNLLVISLLPLFWLFFDSYGEIFHLCAKPCQDLFGAF